MKKLLSLLFIYCAVITPSLAFITPEESTSEVYIKNHGHSYEMARLIDLQNAQVNGTKAKYTNKDPDWYKSNKAVSFVRRTLMYFDCGLDDNNFMQNNIDYTNRWDDL